MKAIQLLEKDRIELRDVPVPEIGPDEMLIRVRAASICGTDVRMWKNGYKNVSPENPLTMGHEFAGDIAKLGGNVTGYSVGQRVAVAPNYGCGTCDLCASGNTHLCETYDAFGVTVDGGFAEYVKIPAAAIRQGNISPMDDDITYQEAALLEPLSCVYNGQLLIGVRPGDDVLVIGLGPIGLMHIMTAKLFGAGKIFVNDLSKERTDKAAELFPDVIPICGDVKKGLAACGQKGVDLCIIAAPAPTAQAESPEYMNMNGRLLFFGGLPKGREIVPINTNLIHYRQLRIQGCTKQSISEYRICEKLVNDKRIPLGLIMSDTYAPEEFETAFANAAAAKGLKHVFVFEE
ncbi:MAG: alcohol dehydrogenase catalytic domain-containing protein [Oscillospiraceae bacterium]|nr:alcohol dehydrogenase catalytic domain-containing protein [Oscillospiraceae bacterium]